MLIDTSRTFVNKLILETFMGKEKEKELNFFTTFYISHKAILKLS